MTVLSSTSIQPFGIIPFGSSDPSVVLNCSLETAASVTAAGGTVVGAPTFSADGMTNTSAADYVKFSTITGYANLSNAGQMSFDVPLDYIAGEDGGSVIPINSYIISASAVDSVGVTPYFRIYVQQDTVNDLVVQMTSSDVIANARPGASNLDTSDTVRVTVSWSGNRYSIYYDGRLQVTATRVDGQYTDIFKYIWIGNDRGDPTDGTQMYGYPIHNLTIATRPVMLPRHPALAAVAIIGHSFVAGGDPYPTTGSYGWDKSIGRCISGYLANEGLYLAPTFYAESGAVLDSSLSATNLDAEIASAVAARPTLAIFVVGANDVSNAGFSVASFEAAYKTYIDSLSTCEIIVVTTVTSSIGYSSIYTDTVITNTAAANEVINALPDYDSRVVVADIFSALGGESVGSNYWEGEFSGAYNDRHPTPRACRIIGEQIGAKIWESL